MKRIRRELDTWPDDGCELSLDASDLRLHVSFRDLHTVLKLPATYPFSPPIHSIRFLTHPLDVATWAIAVLSAPFSRSAVESPRVSCMCCHSVTCPDKWAPARTLHTVVHEAVFMHTYRRVEDIRMPVALPDDVWIHMVNVSVP